MDINSPYTFADFLDMHPDPRRPGLPSYFERACLELGISTPHVDTAAETVAALMPAGGPACEDIPIERIGTIAAALAWGSALAHYPPVWFGTTPAIVSRLSTFCGAILPDNPNELWTRAIPALRERFCAQHPGQAGFTPPAGFTRKAGSTIASFHNYGNHSLGNEFQLLCDEDSVPLPFHADDILDASLKINSEWDLEFRWGLDLSPRELVAIHFWFAAGRSTPIADRRWHSLPAYLVSRAKLAHRVMENLESPLHIIRHIILKRDGRLPVPSPRGQRFYEPVEPGDTSAAISWLTYGIGHLYNLGAPFFEALVHQRGLTPSNGRDSIQVLVDLTLENGLTPEQIPPRLHIAAACALTWCSFFADNTASWQFLSTGSHHFILAICGIRPQPNEENRRHLIETIRPKFEQARRAWLALPDPRRSYPRLNTRSPKYDISMWISSGIVPLHGSYWFVTDHVTTDSSRSLTQYTAMGDLASLAILSRTPPGPLLKFFFPQIFTFFP
jgi:hypothetical protein